MGWHYYCVFIRRDYFFIHFTNYQSSNKTFTNTYLCLLFVGRSFVMLPDDCWWGCSWLWWRPVSGRSSVWLSSAVRADVASWGAVAAGWSPWVSLCSQCPETAACCCYSWKLWRCLCGPVDPLDQSERFIECLKKKWVACSTCIYEARHTWWTYSSMLAGMSKFTTSFTLTRSILYQESRCWPPLQTGPREEP